jgi:uncharacterized protein YrzB (UPF0473 family)
MEKVAFIDPIDGENVEFYVLEQTKINGKNYILVTEDEEGDCDCYIMRESVESDGETTYDMVEDDTELNAVAKVFAEMMDDVDIV